MQRDVKVDTIIMDNFYKLVHSQENIRLTAASSTYKILNTMKSNRPQIFNENLNYCIERLVAGLASSRAQARRGYGTLLLEILNSYHVSTERLFTIAQKKFAHISKETSRDNLLAYFLLISIILESGNYKRTKGNSQYIEKIYKCLIQLRNTKSYLEYPVIKLLVDYREQLYPFMVADIPAHAFESDAKVSALELLVIVICHEKEPIRKVATLDSSELMSLCSTLLDDKLQKRPLHPVFIEILFKTFFKANHNELAAMGLELTSLLIRSTNDTKIIRVLLNDHLIRMLILSLRNQTHLKSHSVKLFSSMQDIFKNEPDEDKQFTIIDILTSGPAGSIKFDEDSKSLSLRNLLQNCNHSTLIKYLDKLMKVIRKPEKEELQSIARQISFLIKRPQMLEDLATMKKVSQYFLSRIVSTEKQLDESVKSSFKNAYHNVLDQVVSSSNSTQRIELLDDLVEYYDQLESCLKDEMWQSYKLILHDYRKLIVEHEDPKILYPITTLFLFYGLQVIEHKLDCREQLEELMQSSREALSNQSEVNSWADILTDQIIAILSATECKPWIRKLCEKVFSLLLPHISGTSIDLICEAIKAPFPGHDGDDEDSYCSSEEEEEGDSEEEEDDDEIDDEESDPLSAGGSEENEEPLDVVSREECYPDQQKSNLESNTHNKRTSKTAQDSECQHSDGDDSGKSDDDMKAEDEEEEYLNDEQMLKLDSVIADMFKLNRKKKADPSFKLRCLDLIKILLKKHKDPEIINTVLATVIPLYTSSRKSSETRPISHKIVGFLGKMPGKSKYPKLIDFLEKQQNKKLKF